MLLVHAEHFEAIVATTQAARVGAETVPLRHTYRLLQMP